MTWGWLPSAMVAVAVSGLVALWVASPVARVFYRGVAGINPELSCVERFDPPRRLECTARDEAPFTVIKE